MRSEEGLEQPDEGRDAGQTHSGRDRQRVAAPGTGGPGAERAILIILILILLCAVLGVAAGIMVIVSRNSPGGGATGAFLTLLT